MYFMRVSPQHLHEVVYVDRSNKHILFYHPIPSYFATKLSVTMHPLKGTIWNAANIEDPSLWKVSKHVFHSNQFIWEGGGDPSPFLSKHVITKGGKRLLKNWINSMEIHSGPHTKRRTQVLKAVLEAGGETIKFLRDTFKRLSTLLPTVETEGEHPELPTLRYQAWYVHLMVHILDTEPKARSFFPTLNTKNVHFFRLYRLLVDTFTRHPRGTSGFEPGFLIATRFPEYNRVLTAASAVLTQASLYCQEQHGVLHVFMTSLGKKTFWLKLKRTSSASCTYHMVRKKGAWIYCETSILEAFAAEYRSLELGKHETVILTRLHTQLKPFQPLLEEILTSLTFLDVITSWAYVIQRSPAKWCVPLLSTTEIRCLEITHPLVPHAQSTDVKIPQGDLQVWTGEHEAGKTTLMRALGLVFWLQKLGCYVPCASCFLPPITELFFVLEERNPEGSTFQRHMEAVHRGLVLSRRNALVFIDELCSSTNTKEGKEICHLLLNRDHGERTVVTSSHFHDLPGTQKHLYQYQLKPGISQRNNVNAVLMNLGFSTSFVDSVTNAVRRYC